MSFFNIHRHHHLRRRRHRHHLSLLLFLFFYSFFIVFLPFLCFFFLSRSILLYATCMSAGASQLGSLTEVARSFRSNSPMCRYAWHGWHWLPPQRWSLRSWHWWRTSLEHSCPGLEHRSVFVGEKSQWSGRGVESAWASWMELGMSSSSGQKCLDGL